MINIEKAREWYENHTDHVNSLIIPYKGVIYEPSDEDREHPELWKPAHWKWFFLHYEEK